MRTLASLSAALLCALGAVAQHPQWRTTLPPVQRSGLHAVRLSPEVVGRSKPGLQDIRLLAPDSTLVPYLVRTVPESISAPRAIPFAVLRNERVGKRTVVEFEVPAGMLMDGLELGIRNAQVNKSARITGSDDRLHQPLDRKAFCSAFEPALRQDVRLCVMPCVHA